MSDNVGDGKGGALQCLILKRVYVQRTVLNLPWGVESGSVAACVESVVLLCVRAALVF